MDMMVAVEVGNANATIQHPLYLRAQFFLQLTLHTLAYPFISQMTGIQQYPPYPLESILCQAIPDYR